MGIRAKFQCENKTPNADDPTVGGVFLRAVLDGSPENKEFFQLTPAGSLSLATINPNAFTQFEQGQSYYIDITPAE